MTATPRATGPFTGTHFNDGLLPPSKAGKDARSMSAASFNTAKQGQSYARSINVPGSLAPELKSFNLRIDLSRTDLACYGGFDEGGEPTTSEQRQAEYRDRIDKEMKIKVGTENLLEALNAKHAKQAREQRKVVELELNTSNRKITQLQLDLEAEIQRNREQAAQTPMSPKGRLSQLFRSAPTLSPSQLGQQPGEDESAHDMGVESPTYILAEILQALEAEGMPSDYYVGQANDLVELFKRHQTLKYDLAWSIFGLRMQMVMLSDSREVVAAGYRVMRYAITDRKSLQTIRALQTDYLVILSLVKESKARVEREQALKFIRTFLDVKGGEQEIHPAVARIVVAVADHQDDQLRGIAILTLAEMLLKHPILVANAGGLSVLSEAMGSGIYFAPETLIEPFLHLMDLPARRGLLKSGFEFSSAFASFTEPILTHAHEDRLRASTRVVAALFKSWPGLMALSLHDFLPVRSVVSSLYVTSLPVRTAVLDLLISILHIKSPSWSSSFIGGRRLTTYGRVTNLRIEQQDSQGTTKQSVDHTQKRSLVQHFTAISLAVLLRQGLLKALMHAESDAPTQALRRRTSLLVAEVLRMSSELLPSSWSYGLQAMPSLFDAAINFRNDERFQAVATVYQVDSINRTLYRSISGQEAQGRANDDGSAARARAASKTQVNATMDETQFRAKMLDTQCLNTVNYTEWDWPLIMELIEGAMVNPKRLQEAMITSKLVHRLLGFLRPFKYRFSDAPNTKANQRYVRTACALLRLLLQTTEGARYLEGNKLVPQIGECLAQQDPMSGITSKTPLFSLERMSETLVGGYFAMLGVMCSDAKGMQILERWKIINIFYHIVELKDRDDLIRGLLGSLEYTLDSHPRIILGKAMVATSKGMRITATKILRKYAMMPIEVTSIIGGGAAEWAIKLLVSQLYDPEIEVCEVAIKILEEACNDITSLEYVVKCRPALDHLGEIGAPLLLRFLSTSVGYHYLDGLDYITKEMDDWFLGRNDTYVTIVEASLARALAESADAPPHQAGGDEGLDPQDFGCVPPHFYRELTRTAEGCELLRAKGHFEEFAAEIRDFALEDEDAEVILKVKGCLWAVGNVGSMELGAEFLERTDVVRDVVRIAEMSRVLTLRGTAVFVLGLVSRSLHGQEILAEWEWDGETNEVGESLGYVLPLDFGKLFALQPARADDGKADSSAPVLRSRRGSVSDADATNTGILNAIVKLGNTVLTNKALAELNAYKGKKAAGFQTPALFRKVMVLLASHAYRIPQYRFVIDLFDKSVLWKIVLEEEEEGEDGGSDGVDSAKEDGA